MAGDNIFKRVARAMFKPSAEGAQLPTGDIAWSEDSKIYAQADFEKYNPDDLIGRKGYGIYKRMMQDEQVKAVVKFKRDAITSRDYTFELDADKHGISEEEAERRIAMSYHTIDQMKGSFHDGINGVMAAMYNGVSITEKIFVHMLYEGKTYWGLEALKVKPYDTFYFHPDAYGNVEKVVQKFGSDETEVDIQKFIHYVFNPDIDEHYGQSELREAYRAWFSKDIIYKFRNMYLERHAGGFRWAQPEDGKEITPGSLEETNLRAVMQNINTATGIVLPAKIKLNSSYPTNNVAFREAIEDQDTAIARALLVPNLLGVSPKGDTGSQSLGETQLDAFFWTLEADASRLEEALNEQLFRQLGESNFGDDAWPRFKFKPVSNRQMMTLVKTWEGLVTAGAVQQSPSDEAHIRSMMEFPAKTQDDLGEGGGIVDPSTALSGAQVTSLLEVINTVATGVAPMESGIEILVSAFPINRDQAVRILEGIEVKPPTQPGEPDVTPTPQQVPAEQDTPDVNEEDEQEDDEDTAEIEQTKDSTIIGKGSISVGAFTRAVKRVDFAVIDNTSEAIIEEYTDKTAEVMGIVIEELIASAKEGGELDDDVSDNLESMFIKPKVKQKLNRVISSMLKDGHAVGERHAENEIDKAKGKALSRSIDRGRLKLIAADYFKVKALKVTGDLTDEAKRLVESEILNGARYGKSWTDVEESIYQTFAKKGLISPEQAKDALGEALGVDSPDARLRTNIRTNLFDAVNTARYDYMTDPGLDGFVLGFEYSAILDGRTTQICRHLDEEDAGNHYTDWYANNPEYRPPNHYNCRSLLVAVTEVDEEDFVEGPEPSMEPQDGFK